MTAGGKTKIDILQLPVVLTTDDEGSVQVDITDIEIIELPNTSDATSIIDQQEEEPMDMASQSSDDNISSPVAAQIATTSVDTDVHVPDTSKTSQSPRFEASALKTPVVQKVVKKSNSNRVTEARCLTADEIFAAEAEKQRKKKQALEEKKLESKNEN